MTIARFLRWAFLLIFAAYAVRADGPNAAELPSPKKLMRLGRPISLPYVPGIVLFRPMGSLFVVTSADDPSRDTTTVAAYVVDAGRLDTAEAASKVLQTYVLHKVDAMAFSENGNWLFLVGSSNGQGYATRISMPDVVGPQTAKLTEPIMVTIKLAKLPVQPSIAAGRDGALYLGDTTSTRLSEFPRSLFDTAAATENGGPPIDGTKHFAWGRGIHALAVSSASALPTSSDELVFITYETLAKLSAVSVGSATGTTEVVDSLDSPVGKDSSHGDKIMPLAMLMTRGIVSENGKPTASLLVGDYSSRILLAVDYDPLFQTLSPASIGTIDRSSYPLQVDPTTKILKQPILIGSDENQTTILVGDVYSMHLVQMARQGVSLERLGEIDLPGAPTSLAVGSDGGVAVVAIANSHDLQILEASIATPSGAADDVRQLQRELSALGLNVGGIDGVIGAGTIAALGVFNSATGSNVSVNDVSSALRAVSAVRQKCATSGFGCLLNGLAK